MSRKQILILLFSVGLFKSLYFSRIGFGLLDEGESLHNALRILNGDLPYRDFYSIFPPLDNYFFAYVFRIFGSSVLTPRLVMSFIFAFLPAFVFLISRQLTSKRYAIFLSLLVIFIDVNVERLFFLTPVYLGIYLIINGLIKRSPLKLCIAGILFGIVSIFRFDLPGTYFLGFVLAIFLFFYEKHSFPVQEWLLSVSTIITGYFIPAIFLIIWLTNSNLIGEFIRSTVFNSVSVSSLHSIPFPAVLDIFPTEASVASLLASYSAFLGYSILGIYLLAVIYAKKRSWRTWGFLFVGFFSLPYIFGRSEIGHFIKGGMPALILLGYIGTKKKLFMLLSYIFVLVLLTVNIYQNLWWLKFNDQKVMINTNTLILNRTYREGSTLPSAMTLKGSVDFIQENTNNDEYVLTLPYMAGLYYLSDRPAPTQYNNVLSGFIVGEQEQRDFVEEIEEKGVKVVVYDPVNGPKMKNNRLKDYNPLIHNYIMNNFEVVEETQEGWLFMLKK